MKAERDIDGIMSYGIVKPDDRFCDRCGRVHGDTCPILTAASAFGRKGGQAKSERKTAAVRENGKKGGRPRKDGKENER